MQHCSGAVPCSSALGALAITMGNLRSSILDATYLRAVCVFVQSPPQKYSGYYAAVITLPAFSCHNTKCLGSGGGGTGRG